jgi:SSS family solute:Na+ symporter
VVWTDAIQGIILILGALVCAVFLLFSMPEGPDQLFRIAAANHKFSLGSFKLGLTSSTFWVVLIYGIFINLQNFGIDQNYVQRYMTASSDKEAKKSALWWFDLYPGFFIVSIYRNSTFQLLHYPSGYLTAGCGDRQSFSFFHY